MDRVAGWLALNDSHLSVIVPISFISISVVVVIIVCVVCCRRPCASKPPAPPPQPQSQRGCSAPTTSSVTTTTYLPGAAPTASNGLDEYTRCYVAPRLNSSAVEWSGVPAAAGSPPVTAHGVMNVGAVASSSPRLPAVALMSAAPPAMRCDVQYHFYEEC